ncbi:MAG: hypothetical protein RBT75_12240 [Anaerolineae bacterium]|jgi:hypothetical protein|nr:hypothetical protein [Anaerolineae bacterium]
MDYMKIIKRAWNTTWSYKALWIFGILIALSSGGGSSGGGNSGAQFGGGGGEWDFPNTFELPEIATGAIIATIVAVCGFFLLLTIATVIARYVSETALIRMVDDHEETGEKRTIKEGFRLGWSKGAWKMFLLDLLIGVAFGAGIVLILMLAATPLLTWITESDALRAIGTVTAIGAILLSILVAIAVGAVVNALLHFIRRAVILEQKGVFESIREGLAFVKAHLKDVALMWLLMFGINLVVALLMIPVVLLLLVLGAIVGGLPGAAVGALVNLITGNEMLPWIIGGGIGLFIFVAVVAIPSLFAGGVYKTFESSVWTLTYRELHALEQLEAESAPEEPNLPEAIAESM